MLKVGLTGGIGCGKSTVSDIFASLGVPVIDSDVIAREVVEPGEVGLKQIVAHFGDKVLNPDGTLNRKALRNTVFTNPDARTALENILHPLIRKRSNDQLDKLNSPYAVLAIPLLVENNLTATVDRVLVIDCSEQSQIKRICARDDITQEQAEVILAAQCSRTERLQVADDIIDNDQPLAELRDKVESLHRSYLSLSEKS
jgi:dephospho-CoA kinase